MIDQENAKWFIIGVIIGHYLTKTVIEKIVVKDTEVRVQDTIPFSQKKVMQG